MCQRLSVGLFIALLLEPPSPISSKFCSPVRPASGPAGGRGGVASAWPLGKAGASSKGRSWPQAKTANSGILTRGLICMARRSTGQKRNCSKHMLMANRKFWGPNIVPAAEFLPVLQTCEIKPRPKVAIAVLLSQFRLKNTGGQQTEYSASVWGRSSALDISACREKSALRGQANQ